MSRTFNYLTVLVGGAVALGLVTAGTAQSRRSPPPPAPAAAAAPCVDGAGPTYGFFCAPRTQNRAVTACDKNVSGIALTQCREASANSFCQSAGFVRAALFEVNARGELAEVTCNGRTAPATMAAGPAAKRLTLFNDDRLGGTPVVITSDVANLQSVPAADGFDGTANDYAFSLRAEGRWEVCMDADFRTRCRVVDGEVASLGEDNGSISSVRYLGPSTMAASTGASPAVATAAAPQPGSNYQPMVNQDFLGSDLPSSFQFTSAGSSWQQCAAACDKDRQCKAFTYVKPGRTPYGECFLKNPVPEPSGSDCCISGVKGVGPTSASAPAGARGAAGNRQETVADRLAREAADEAEQRAREETRRGVRGLLNRVIRPE